MEELMCFYVEGIESFVIYVVVDGNCTSFNVSSHIGLVLSFFNINEYFNCGLGPNVIK